MPVMTDVALHLPQGDPSLGCRRECETSYECAPQLACIRFKCVDPCPGTCGINADCRVQNHVPECYCINGYEGNPYLACQLQPGRSPCLFSLLSVPSCRQNQSLDHRRYVSLLVKCYYIPSKRTQLKSYIPSTFYKYLWIDR